MLHWRDLSSVLRIIRRPSRPPKSGARAGRPSSERRYRAVTAIMSRLLNEQISVTDCFLVVPGADPDTWGSQPSVDLPEGGAYDRDDSPAASVHHQET